MELANALDISNKGVLEGIPEGDLAPLSCTDLRTGYHRKRSLFPIDQHDAARVLIHQEAGVEEQIVGAGFEG